MNALEIALVTFTAVLAVSMPLHAETSVDVEALPRTSSFDSKSIERDPFLPIGWQKKTVLRERPRELTITPDAFRVTSIVIGGGGAGLAIINGRGYAAGESIRVNVGGHDVGVLVKEVKDGEVVFLHNGQDIHASMISQ